MEFQGLMLAAASIRILAARASLSQCIRKLVCWSRISERVAPRARSCSSLAIPLPYQSRQSRPALMLNGKATRVTASSAARTGSRIEAVPYRTQAKRGHDKAIGSGQRQHDQGKSRKNGGRRAKRPFLRDGQEKQKPDQDEGNDELKLPTPYDIVPVP